MDTVVAEPEVIETLTMDPVHSAETNAHIEVRVGGERGIQCLKK